MKKRILSIVLSLAMVAAVAINPLVSYATDAGLPSDVVFESLKDTVGKESVTAGDVNVVGNVGLGAVRSQTTGFKCLVTHPGSVTATTEQKRLMLGLYNTKSGDPWSQGYTLFMFPGSSETEITWQIKYHNNLGASGTISNITGEEIMIYAWLNGTDSANSAQLNVIINDTQLVADWTPSDIGKEFTVSTGNHMSVHNLLCDEVVVKHVPVEIPSDITFESIGNTTGKESVSVPNVTVTNKNYSLGAVSSKTAGFKCLVTHPGSVTETTSQKRLMISLYNTGAGNPWSEGYGLFLFPVSETEITWQVLYKNGSTIGSSGTISNITGEDVMVYAWLNGTDSAGSAKLNVVINDTQLVADWTPLVVGSDWKVGTGVYMNAQNSLSVEDAVVKHIPAEVPTDVAFEDLGQTAEVNKVKAPKRTTTSLGEVSSEATGFKAWVQHPGSVEPSDAEKRYYIGLYNTKADPWKGGYGLRLSYVSEDTLKWEVMANTIQSEKMVTVTVRSGQITGITEDKIMVYAWLNETGAATGNALLNVIINNIQIAEDLTVTEHAVEIGKHMSVYNALCDMIEIETVTRLEEEVVNIPTNVTFEDLGQTAGVNKVKVANKTTVGLGEVSSETTGFKTWVQHPGSVELSNPEKRYYIGLYNTKEDPWKGGYCLRLTYVSEDTLKWEVMANTIQSEKMVTVTISSGQITDITDDKIMVYAWLNGTDATTGNPLLNVIVGNKQVAKDVTTAEHSLVLGKYMSSYNALCDMLEIETVTRLEEGVLELPSNVTFEDLGQTAEANSVAITNKSGASLGKVSNATTGFKVWVQHPGSVEPINPEKRYYIGLYNTAYADPWKGGYILRLTYVSEDTLKWEVLANTIQDGKGVMELVKSGQITDITEDKIMVYAWLNGTDTVTGNPLLNVIVGNKQVVKDVTTTEYSIKMGRNMTSYNALASTITFETVTPMPEPDHKVPTNVKFEDLGQMLGMNSVKALNKSGVHLGEVSSETTGFKVWVTHPGSVEPSGEKRYIIGFYNTKKADPWRGGYSLRLSYVSEDTLKWEVMVNTIQDGKMVTEVMRNGQLTGITDDKIMVYAWLSGKDAATGNPLLNVILGNTRILTNKTTDENQVTIGRYMTAYNVLGEPITFETTKKVELIPSNIKFEDLGQTLRENTVKVLHKKGGDLGQVSSTKTGFVCKVPHPGSLELIGEKRYYIGLYNVKKADPWKSGYILRLTASGDSIVWDAFANSVEGMKHISGGVVPEVTGDEVILYAWLDGTDKETKNPLLNVILGNTRILKNATSSEVTVVAGRYMSVYNVVAEEIEINTITRIVTLREKYMARFGHVTDPDYIAVYDTSALDKLEQEEQVDVEEQKDSLAQAIVDKITNSAIIKEIFGEEADSSVVLVVLGGVAALLIAAGTATGIILFKRKKKRTQPETTESVDEE